MHLPLRGVIIKVRDLLSQINIAVIVRSRSIPNQQIENAQDAGVSCKKHSKHLFEKKVDRVNSTYSTCLGGTVELGWGAEEVAEAARGRRRRGALSAGGTGGELERRWLPREDFDTCCTPYTAIGDPVPPAILKTGRTGFQN